MQRELMAAVWAVELHVLLTQTKEQLTKKLMVVGMRHFSRPGNLVSLRNQTPSFWGHSSAGFNGLEVPVHRGSKGSKSYQPHC